LRLIPVGFAVVVVTALLLQVSIDASESASLGQSLLGFVLYGLPLVAIIAVVSLIPISLVWLFSYAAMRFVVQSPRTRAIVASSLCALIGNVAVASWMGSLSDRVFGTLLLLPAAVFSVLLSALLTRSVFDRASSETE
jgi:hypothetical protein